MKRFWIWLPLVMFFVFFAVVAAGLVKPADRTIASRLVGKPVPQFSLPPGASDRPGVGTANFRSGEPRLLNVFASWCLPCIAEAPVLMELAENGVPIDAIAIRDKRQDVDRFLARNGNPFQRIGLDVDGKVQITLGSSGVPETFVVDGRGVIRHQHVGDIREEDIPEILDALRRAR